MLRKLKIKLARKFSKVSAPPDVKESDNHNIAFSIFRLALRDPEADLLLRPVKNKRIIKLENKELYIILNRTILEITNHDYSFTLEIPYSRFLKLSKMFDAKLDSLIEKEEGNITSQVHVGLIKVLNRFKTKETEYDRSIERSGGTHPTVPAKLPAGTHSQPQNGGDVWEEIQALRASE